MFSSAGSIHCNSPRYHAVVNVLRLRKCSRIVRVEYKDNVKVGSAVGTNAPDDEELAVSFGIQNGEAVAKVMTLDYISAGKERTANTEL